MATGYTLGSVTDAAPSIFQKKPATAVPVNRTLTESAGTLTGASAPKPIGGATSAAPGMLGATGTPTAGQATAAGATALGGSAIPTGGPLPIGVGMTGGAIPTGGPMTIGSGNWSAPPPSTGPNQFGPGNDLIYSQIGPTTDPRLGATQGAVDAARQAIGSAPSRTKSAQDLFASFLTSSEPTFQQNLRDITQRNAAAGRLGSGMYGSDLTDAATSRQRDITSKAAQLAYDTTGGDIQDRLNNLNAFAGLEGQQFGQGLTQRNELRGERGYQQGVANQANQDAVNQWLLEQQAGNDAWNRDQQRLALLGQYGYGGGTPASFLGGLSGQYSAGAGQSAGNAADLLSQFFLGL